jgi:hypothetical protein
MKMACYYFAVELAEQFNLDAAKTASLAEAIEKRDREQRADVLKKAGKYSSFVAEEALLDMAARAEKGDF